MPAPQQLLVLDPLRCTSRRFCELACVEDYYGPVPDHNVEHPLVYAHCLQGREDSATAPGPWPGARLVEPGYDRLQEDTLVDALARHFFELRFKLAFLELRGESFQHFFSSIMGMRHPADFQPSRPWSQSGDRKCDGYLRSQRTLFQVYAPNEMSARRTLAKIDGDFKGALPFWENHFDHWVFVHNARDGLGPDVVRRLLELDRHHANIRVEAWGFEELRQITFSLPEEHLAALLGPPPTLRGMLRVGVAELMPVLDQIARLQPRQESDLRPVPADKLEANLLSNHVATLLHAGMVREELVGDYFRARMDPRTRDEIAESFRRRYLELRAEGISPDDVFSSLQRWVGGDDIGAPHHQEAVLAVLAYMFQRCDIFDRAPGGSA